MNSMTGFGKGENDFNQQKISVEISGINRKQAEIVINLPKTFNEQEVNLRKLILSQISRGRVVVSIQISQIDETSSLRANAKALLAWKNVIQDAERVLNQKLNWNLADIMLWDKECFSSEPEINAQDLWEQGILPAFENALKSFLEMKKREGMELRRDLEEKLNELAQLAAKIRLKEKSVPKKYHEMLLMRLRASGLELDFSDERVIKEVAIFAERCDISEELTRLDCHIKHFNDFLINSEKSPAGRPLDFLCQELHRELTTLSNKANDAEISHLAVSAKTLLEKIREQVQNAE